MSKNEKLNDQDNWLAAEYALGVLNGTMMKQAEARMGSDPEFRACVESWQVQLTPLLDEVEEVTPSASVWRSVDKRLFGGSQSSVVSTGDNSASGFWKLMTALTSTLAVACFAVLMVATGGDFTGKEISQTKLELASARLASEKSAAELEAAKQELNSAAVRLADMERNAETTQAEINSARQQLETATLALEAANQELETVMQEVVASRPLVASLTQSGDAPAFVAQYDPLKKALLIRTAVEDTDEKVPEVWLIPAQGDRKGEVLSLGVMDENAPDTLPIDEDFVSLIGEGGTLAITMEPVGGAPNGVATGPVIALGQLQAF